ncbi:MAG: hypothetical protein LBI66_00845 [Burkholderiaceae bacterium]|nr:hypothetical protein [Burkholderiaceae bacterium]
MNQRILWTVGLAAPVALLVGALSWAWLTPDLQPRNVAWQPPEPIKADIRALVPASGAPEDLRQRDEQLMLAMQERPLFSITRRPPPPPPPPPPEKKAQQEVPDIWKQASVTGIFEGPVSGIIFTLDGKERRLLLNQNFAGWKLQSLQGRNVVLESNGQTRTLQLVKAALDKGPNMPPGLRVPPALRVPPQPNAQGQAPEPDAGPDAPTKPEEPQAVFGGTGQPGKK